MNIADWISGNYIEVFGAVTGILYVILEIRQNIWLWPVGIVTSAVYIWVFFTGKLYADMSLQGYYLIISILGWFWWLKGVVHRARGTSPLEGANHASVTSPLEGGEGGVSSPPEKLKVTRLNIKTGMILSVVFAMLYIAMWQVLDRFTDSPVPAGDAFITSLSIIATWMLARKIIEHWYLWMIVNAGAALLFYSRGLYPTVILYIVYCAMSFVGLAEWRKSLKKQ